SLISFSSVFVLTLIIFEVDRKYESDELFIRKPLRIYTWIMVIIVYLTIYTGALVRYKEESLDYSQCPIKLNDIIPHNDQDWVNFTHRCITLIAFIWILITFVHEINNYKENRTIRFGYTAAFILIILQVITGALSIITEVNLLIALLHALFITILFGLIAYFIVLMLRTIRSGG